MEDLRKVWAEHLIARGIKFVFFSAFDEQERLLKQEQQARTEQKKHLQMKIDKQDLMRKNKEDKNNMLDLLKYDDELDGEHQTGELFSKVED